MPFLKSTRAVVVDPPALRPQRYFNVVSNAPLASCLLPGYACSRLKKQGLDAGYFDASGERDLDAFENRLLEMKPEEIYVNLLFQWENTGKILESLRKIRASSRARLFLFGYYPTFFKDELLREFPFVDSIIEGDPLGEGSTAGPFPRIKKGECAPMLGSKGCWGNCTFCYAGRFFDGYKGRDARGIVDEMEQRVAEGFKKVYFVDPCFFPPGKQAGIYAAGLAKEIMKRGRRIPFGLECRADSVSPDAIDPLAEAGLTEVFLGVESGAQSALDRFHKRTTVDQNERAIALIQDRRIKLSTGFIMFDPEVTLAELGENLKFLRRNGLVRCATNAAQLLSHKVFLYAGTPMYKRYVQKLNLNGRSPYFIDYPFHDKKIQRIYSTMEVEAQRVFDKFRGMDIDGPVEGSHEKAEELHELFDCLLNEKSPGFEKRTGPQGNPAH
ncbi:MAG: radical SAM protein [Nitrospinae bacterium]|nr:radical SAM protein [Nitrospinota bacterium]